SGIPEVPRVSDVAMNLIESVSQCKFSSGYSTPAYLYGMQPEARTKFIEHIERWWSENKEKSVIEGIRAQLPHGDYHTKITMAENLIRIAGDKDAQDREYGLGVLRELSGDPYSSAAADALARYGDFSPLQEYYERFSSWLQTRGRLWDGTLPGMFYMAEYGG